MFSFSVLFLNELVKTKQNDLVREQLLNIKMGEKFVRGKKKSSLAEKNELGELVEKYDKNTRKNMIKK